MNVRIPFLALACAATLAACGGETPPAPATVKSEPAVEQPAAPAAAPQAAVPAPPPAAPVPPPSAPATSGVGQDDFASKPAAALIPSDAIGGSPILNRDDAYARAKNALDKYCVDNSMSCEGFYAKERPVEMNGAWVVRFFGRANGSGTYMGVRVYNDGRAEVIR